MKTRISTLRKNIALQLFSAIRKSVAPFSSILGAEFSALVVGSLSRQDFFLHTKSNKPCTDIDLIFFIPRNRGYIIRRIITSFIIIPIIRLATRLPISWSFPPRSFLNEEKTVFSFLAQKGTIVYGKKQDEKKNRTIADIDPDDYLSSITNFMKFALDKSHQKRYGTALPTKIVLDTALIKSIAMGKPAPNRFSIPLTLFSPNEQKTYQKAVLFGQENIGKSVSWNDTVLFVISQRHKIVKQFGLENSPAYRSSADLKIFSQFQTTFLNTVNQKE